MANALQRLLIAGAVSGAAIQGGAALGQDREVVLTEQQQIAVNLVREYNTCVAAEDTPERALAIEEYDLLVAQAELQYAIDDAEFDKARDAYYEAYRRITEEYGIERILGVPEDYSDLSKAVEFTQAWAIEAKIHALVEAETGLTEPEYIGSLRDRIEALGDKPQRAVDVCSDRISPKFEEAGIDIDWDLQGILHDVIQKQGPDAYEALVAPEGP